MTTPSAHDVIVDQWTVETSAGRDYMIELPSFPRVYTLWVGGEYAGDFPTLIAAVRQAGDLDARDPATGQHVPHALLGRTLTGPTMLFRPADAAQPDEWVTVKTRADRRDADYIYRAIVGSPPPDMQPSYDLMTGVTSMLVPAALADVVVNRLLMNRADATVTPIGGAVRFRVAYAAAPVSRAVSL